MTQYYLFLFIQYFASNLENNTESYRNKQTNKKIIAILKNYILEKFEKKFSIKKIIYFKNLKKNLENYIL